jgi:hypothetical protein
LTVNICGIPHKIIECKDSFNSDAIHFGEIDFAKAEIMVNQDATPEIKQETIYHEVVHGILVHIGREELSMDETFVQTLSSAIRQSFELITKSESDRTWDDFAEEKDETNEGRAG